MLAIRFQRVGRSGHAEFRIIVQEARRSPASGKVVAQVGHYNPHTKAVSLDKEKASFYLNNGAQPSDRVAKLLTSEGVKLPSWVSVDTSKKRTVKNTDKLKRNRPAEEPKAAAEEPVSETTEETPAPESAAPEETVAAEPADTPAAE